MTWERSLLKGMAAQVAQWGVARWDPTGAYTTGTGPAQFIRFIPDKPDAIITLDLLTLTPGHPTQGQVMVGFVFRARGNGDTLTAEDTLSSLYQHLHGATGLTLDGIPVPLVWHQSDLPLGLDPHGRDQHTATYHAWTVRASAHTE